MQNGLKCQCGTKIETVATPSLVFFEQQFFVQEREDRRCTFLHDFGRRVREHGVIRAVNCLQIAAQRNALRQTNELVATARQRPQRDTCPQIFGQGLDLVAITFESLQRLAFVDFRIQLGEAVVSACQLLQRDAPPRSSDKTSIWLRSHLRVVRAVHLRISSVISVRRLSLQSRCLSWAMTRLSPKNAVGSD